MANLILIITATLTALIAGLFYAYSCSVNPGLGKLSDREYINAMNSINVAILNPVFFTSFMGTLILLPLSAYLNYTPEFNIRFILLLIAALVYAVGVFGVTMFGNVPLNDALANFNTTTASVKEMIDHRTIFEGPWNFLHTIRTIANIVSLVLVIVSCLCERK
ncbi:MAG: putative integral rane protein [Mucilaginibacter sp.]|nr:putative integral rane protein [Mucilaginibacter sp.]